MNEIGLSILLPTYNVDCVQLVRILHRLCSDVENLAFEIFVLDDASKDKDTIAANDAINDIENCSFLRSEDNRGSGAVRNDLARRAHYEWLLFLDSDVEIPRPSFILSYIETIRRSETPCVINGGIEIGNTPGATPGNIRYMYEKAEEENHNTANRCRNPYKAFRSTNFIIHRDIMIAHPFDERFRRYEDVMLGKTLCEQNIEIKHIDNPVVIDNFENNAEFIAKVERSLQVLHEFRNDLDGYSPIISLTRRLCLLLPAVRLWHKLFGAHEKANLTGCSPSLIILRLYQLGYYVSLSM